MKGVYGIVSQKALHCFQNVVDVVNYYVCNATTANCDDSKSVCFTEPYQEPMPSPAKVDEEFNIFVANLDLPEANCRALKNLSIEKKWMILVERKNRQCVAHETPATHVTILNNEIQIITNGNKCTMAEMMTALETLHISIRTQPQSYVQEFIDLNGLNCLFDLLTLFKCKLSEDGLLFSILNVIKSLLNSKIGQNAVLGNEKLLRALASLAGIVVGKSKILVLQILGGLCLVQDGREKVVASFKEAQCVTLEKMCFQRVIWQLTEKFYPEKVDVSTKIVTMSFINVLLNSGEAKNNLDERLKLRNHFLILGLDKIIHSLRHYEHPVLQDHFDLFEMMQMEDEQEFAKRCQLSIVDTSSPSLIVELLEHRLKHNDESFYSFLSILQNLMLIPIDKRGQDLWKLFNMFIENIASEVSADSGANEENISVSTELQKVLQKIHTENDYRKLLADYERVTKRLTEVEAQFNDTKKEKASILVKTESYPNLLPSIAQNPEPGVVSTKLAIVHPLKPNVVAPSPPPLAPPLPAKIASPAEKKSSFFKPSTNLKGLNWVLIPDIELEGTVWSDCTVEDINKLLDVEVLDKNFSILTKNKRDSLAEGNGQVGLFGKHISLLEPRRAQNCHILLSKLKMTNEEIQNLVMTFDPKNVVPKDMVEQMLKFIPTKEEIKKLNEAENDSNLNQIDQFFLLMNKIPRYEQRLRCLWLSKIFSEKASEIKVQAEAVIKASKILKESKRIKKMLQIILAIGNHMNEGKRNGSARAFHVSSLVNLVDVKSSLKCEYTLMHYLVEFCESKFPEIFRLKRELLSTTEASKVLSNELETEMSVLRNGINLVEIELNQKNSHSDVHFYSIMTTFLKDNKIIIMELQSILTEMEQSYKSCLKIFGINFLNQPITSGEFFAVFARFLSSLSNVRKCMKQEKENQDRRLETLSQIRMKRALSREIPCIDLDKEKTSSPLNVSYKKDNLQDFEALISALQNGDLFLDDLHRLRTSFRKNARKNKPAKVFYQTETRER